MRTAWKSIRRSAMMLFLISILALATLAAQSDPVTASPESASVTPEVVSERGGLPPLCRFGVNVTGGITEENVADLRIGWYINYSAFPSPLNLNYVEHMPIIRLQQIGLDDYGYSPNGDQLQQAIAANPGTDWLIGNEPDRRHWQDDLEPGVYARAYHELYYLIKSADPTARIVAGNIVQPTPIRLAYLDLVLSSYHDLYGESMPVDVWGIHNFILNEVSCEYDPTYCWGAGIPPGIDADEGERLNIKDNDNFALFRQRIERFRLWMADHGYGGLPVFLSEYGILMPSDIADEEGNAFPPSRVNAFMDSSFDYLYTATDPILGDPHDGFRLVQRLSWYSTSDDHLNGRLIESDSTLSEIGSNYAANAAQVSPMADLYAAHVYANPATPISQGESVTFTLKAMVANSGNISSARSIVVRFFDGDPSAGGVQIGADQVLPPLPGCGGNGIAQVEWAGVAPGAHQVYAIVDPSEAIPESDEMNNVTNQTILVATHQTFLAAIHRGSD